MEMREDRSKALALVGANEYIIKFWDDLTIDMRDQLMQQYSELDVDEVQKEFKDTASADKKIVGENIMPIDREHFAAVSELDEISLCHYRAIGLKAIAERKVAAIVLAGGQASRLGLSQPKGTLPLGFGVKSIYNSLFSLQAAQISRLQKLAESEYKGSMPLIWWIIMASKATRDTTLEHINEILPLYDLIIDQVTIICQDDVPCFDEDGKLLLSSKSKIAVSPNGNGGLYKALIPEIAGLRAQGVEYLHVYCVDNVLCRVADTNFLGYCITMKVDCAAKAVEKIDPEEKVGVICRGTNGVCVVEYSEIPKELAEEKDSVGRLKFRAGNIANHFFTMDFLENACYKAILPYHRAFKKVPFVSSSGDLVVPDVENAYKLERFVFDVFRLSRNFHVWEVERKDEFSPLKNSNDIGLACLKTCRRDYSERCKRWLERTGATISGDGEVFVHPFVSYEGEELEKFKYEILKTPFTLVLCDEKK